MHSQVKITKLKLQSQQPKNITRLYPLLVRSVGIFYWFKSKFFFNIFWITLKYSLTDDDKMHTCLTREVSQKKKLSLCDTSLYMFKEEEQSQGYNRRTMCSFTKFSWNIFFLIKKKLPYDSHLFRHTSEPLKKIVKILETRAIIRFTSFY